MNKPLFTGQRQQKPDLTYMEVEQLIQMWKNLCYNAKGMWTILSYVESQFRKKFERIRSMRESVELHNTLYKLKFMELDLLRLREEQQERLVLQVVRLEAAYQNAEDILNLATEFDEELLRKALTEFFSCLDDNNNNGLLFDPA